MAGLGLAGFFTALTWWTGQPHWDALGSIGVGLLMGAIALQLMRTNKRFLIGKHLGRTCGLPPLPWPAGAGNRLAAAARQLALPAV